MGVHCVSQWLVMTAGLAVVSASPPALDWASQPAFADETVILLGGPFSPTSSISVTAVGASADAANTRVNVDPVQADNGSVKFVLPSGASESQWSVSVDGSKPYMLNAPEPWWVAGDQVRRATAGGWIRVFGSCVAHTSTTAGGAAAGLAAAQEELENYTAMLGRGSNDDIQAASALLQRLSSARRKSLAANASTASTLRLTPTKSGKGSSSSPITIPADPIKSTTWHAWFDVPSSVPPGDYEVAIANALDSTHFVSLSSYVSPAEPAVSTVTILSSQQAKRPWEGKVFNVSDYGPHGLPNISSPTLDWTNASEAISAAIADAEKAGGGTVFLPRGTYFINSTWGFTVPWNVRIQGEGKELVELIFAENWVPAEAPVALFRGPEVGTGAWALSDFTIYVTAFHNMVVYANNRTVGFEMTRVRLTANSFFGGNGVGTSRGREGQSNVTWAMEAPGAAVTLLGSEWVLQDNDLYCDGTVITSTTQAGLCPITAGPNTGHGHCHGSEWGIASGNRIYSAGNSHFMNQWRQVIFENNTIIGISPISQGNSVGTGPGGGFDHHIYHAENSVTFVWGNDREIITFDDAGSAYLGKVAAVSADGLTLTLKGHGRTSGSSEWGGWDGAAVSVLNGTGVGTWRRVVNSGIDGRDAPGEWSNAKNQTWVIDRPFAVDITKDQVISITPARARIIFEKDTFVDGGTLQFYGQAQEVVVDSLTGERMTGTVAWGQWRGYYPPPCGNWGQPPCYNLSSAYGPTRLGGQMGNGIMFNTQLTYLNCHFAVGNKIVRWDGDMHKFYNGATMNIQAVSINPPRPNCNASIETCDDWTDLVATSAVVYRRNAMDNNGGFNINSGLPTTCIRDVIVEGNTVKDSDADKAMQIAEELANTTCILRNNNVPQ